jgi:hypothetical protein
MLFFSTGTLIAVRTDLPSTTIVTPRRFGELQEVSLDISFTTKELKGKKQFSLDVARAGAKVTGKAKTAKFSGRMMADIFFGETLNTGSLMIADSEAASIPATSTYTVTATFPTGHATPIVDLGVVYAATGQPFTKVDTSVTPTIGQYKVALDTGVYTFASADASAAVLLTYMYTATTGVNFTMTNKNMGAAPTFAMYLAGTYQSNYLGFYIYKAMSSKITFPEKMEDYVIPEFDFEIMDPGSGNIGQFSFSD